MHVTAAGIRIRIDDAAIAMMMIAGIAGGTGIGATATAIDVVVLTMVMATTADHSSYARLL
jgi:hypothetical protein